MSKKKKMFLMSLCYICMSFVIVSGFIAIIATGGGDGNQASGTKYLAKNIVFNAENAALAKSSQEHGSGIFAFNILRKAYAQSDDIDTETQILAENVVFENSYISQIESDNVQDALEEISLNLPDVMIGTWNIQNYNQSEAHESTGKVVIYGDGTFDLIEGSFAAIGMGSGTAEDGGMCNHTEENQTYDIYASDLILFSHYNPGTPGSINYSPDNPGEMTSIPRLVKLRENEIIFIGMAGCGYFGTERISILTRVTE
jgi:hypothetical protein